MDESSVGWVGRFLGSVGNSRRDAGASPVAPESGHHCFATDSSVRFSSNWQTEELGSESMVHGSFRTLLKKGM